MLRKIIGIATILVGVSVGLTATASAETVSGPYTLLVECERVAAGSFGDTHCEQSHGLWYVVR